jgi:transposase, IS5 family
MLNRFRLHRALEKLVDLARRHDVPLRLSYRRLAKRAALMALEERFADLLALRVRVRFQDHRQRGRKVYALHAPEVECIGKGKARAPYEFGYKVSVATPATKPKGGQFVLHAKALHGNPFDGHTLEPVIAELEALTGIETRRIRADKGYRGHNHTQKFRVWISGQVRRVSAPIRREIRRRHRAHQGRAPHGPQLPQRPRRRPHQPHARRAGYNFALLLRWLERLLHASTQMLLAASATVQNI